MSAENPRVEPTTTTSRAHVQARADEPSGDAGEPAQGPAVARSRPSSSRPRLSERALPRLHFVDGKCRVLLHDVETGDVAEIGPREWVLLSGADGTRDTDGILAAAAREGARASREALEELLDGLDAAGMLAEGPGARKTGGVDNAIEGATKLPGEAKVERDLRPIEHLPGYTFHCNGIGSCCQLYATVVFSPLEAARARSLRPEVLDGGDRHEHAFMPERGAGPCAGSAVALVNGRCAYLEGSLCSLHRVGGAAAKPLGCNLFPLALVDDGTRVRASVSIECACVLASVGQSEGEPILPATMRVRGDLDPAVVVDELPDAVEIFAGVRAPLAEYARWNDAVIAALSSGADAARSAWALAEVLETHGLDAERARAAIADPSPVDAELAARFLAALEAKAARRAKAQSGWRSERDLCRRGVSIVTGAASLLADPEILGAVTAGAGASPEHEAFYLRVALFGHQIVGYPLATGLRDRAVAMWIGRMFPLAAEALYPGEEEPAFSHPLALVEALLRGHGLRRYTEMVENPTAPTGP